MTISERRMREFDKLCKLQPRLRKLYDKAKSIKDDGSAPRFCANDVWFGKRGRNRRPIRGLRWYLGNLVGSNAPSHKYARGLSEGAIEILKSSRAYDIAYDIAYDVILDAIPECRNCGCQP